MICQWHNCASHLNIKEYVVIEDHVKRWYVNICDEHYLDIRMAGKVKIYDLEQQQAKIIVDKSKDDLPFRLES